MFAAKIVAANRAVWRTQLPLIGYPWMESHPLITLFDAFAEEQLVIIYGGSFPDDHTARLIGLGDDAMGDKPVEKGLRTRTAFVLVEAYQNVVRHRPTSVKDERSTFIFLHATDSTEVITVNAVDADDLPALRTALDRIQGRSPDELKALFLSSLQRNEQTKRGGAGLGLIEMARRSGHGVRHRFWTGTDGTARFALRVRTGGVAEGRLGDTELHNLDQWVGQSGCVLLCCGSPSRSIQETLLRMLGAERALDGELLERAGMAAMELISALHPLREHVLLAWHSTPETRSLHLVLPTPEDPSILKLASELSKATAGEVNRRYRDALLGRTPDHGPGIIGLLDLARRSIEPIRIEMLSHKGRSLMQVRVRL
ncbi:MAG: hypothetical protein IPO05_07600 [Flavobacteriales bacterium]|nr:hypothetical protein [Flavobacteriales bacterium]